MEMASFPNTIQLCLTIALLGSKLILFWIAGVCIYRLYLHPFAKYPGPFWAKLTNGYSAYHAKKQDTHINILQLHEKYGYVVRYGPNRLVFNTRRSLEDIYGANRNLFKGAAYDAMRVQPCASIFNAASDETHAQRRRIISQGFSESAMRASEPTIRRHIDKYCNVLYGTQSENAGDRTEWTKAKDMTIWSSFLAVDLIADLALGQSTDMLTSPTNRVYNAARKANFRRMGMAMQWPSFFLPLSKAMRSLSLGNLIFKRTFQLQLQWHALMESWIGARVRQLRMAGTKDKDTNNYDLVTAIVNYTECETGRGLSNGELVAELATLLIAGSGTITTGMTSTLFYLAHNPDVLARVTWEVRSTFSSRDDIRMGPKLNSCSILRACFQEAMRMSPPPTTPLYREAGRGGATVCGHVIPPGCEVATTTYALHHNEAHFSDSFTFSLDRWLESEGRALADMKASWAPFSYGPRNCVGMTLATNEVMMTVASLLWEGDFRLSDDPKITAIGAGRSGLGDGRKRKGEFQLYATFGASTDGPMLQFRRRVVGAI